LLFAALDRSLRLILYHRPELVGLVTPFLSHPTLVSSNE
jgi:hypothetical protein